MGYAEWISVEDRLPEDGIPVLVSFDLLEPCFKKDRRVEKRGLIGIKRYYQHNPHYYTWEDTEYHLVTHWMHLPQAPI